MRVLCGFALRSVARSGTGVLRFDTRMLGFAAILQILKLQGVMGIPLCYTWAIERHNDPIRTGAVWDDS